MKPVNEKVVCQKASVFYYDYAQNVLGDIEPEILSHIRACSFCQSEVERLKLFLAEPENEVSAAEQSRNAEVVNILAAHFNFANQAVTCGVAKQFLPDLTLPSFDIKVPTPITAHVENCYLCVRDLSAIRELNLTQEQLACLKELFAAGPRQNKDERGFYEKAVRLPEMRNIDNNALLVLEHILERSESGVVTEYIIKSQAGDRNDVEQAKIRIYSEKEKSDDISPAEEGIRRRNNLRKFVKPVIGIAAMFLVTIWLLVGTFAKAIDYDDVYKTIGKIQNICLVSSVSDVEGAIQKIWISKPLNVKLFYSGGQWTLWDIQNKVRKTTSAKPEESAIYKLNAAEVAGVEKTMSIPLVILPFQSPSSLPVKYSWKSLSDKETVSQRPNTYVYDLLWSDHAAGDLLPQRKWRVYINRNTMLPERIENWQMDPVVEQYKLENWIDITYPKTQEIKSLIDNIGGSL